MTKPAWFPGRGLRLGTRGSMLALCQAQLVAQEATRLTGVAVELVRIPTLGDRSSQPVADMDSHGVFATAVRETLAAGAVDFVVHSYKDLPTEPFGGSQLVIAAVPPRATAYDVVVSDAGATLRELRAGARVGTGAPRRVAQLRALRPDLTYVPLRGNVDTRLAYVSSGAVDAVVVAGAAVERLGRVERITERLGHDVVVPAPAQGALAVECRAENPVLVELLSTMDDPLTRAIVQAERTVLAELAAGCQAPLGVYGELSDGLDTSSEKQFQLHGAVVAIDGSRALRKTVRVTRHELMSDAAKIGQRLAADLLKAGSATLMGVEEK